MYGPSKSIARAPRVGQMHVPHKGRSLLSPSAGEEPLH